MADASARDLMQLLAAARQGDRQSFGELTEMYQNYLRLVARVQIDRYLRRRLSPSDLVQDAFLKAFCNLAQFRGNSQQELLAWLRRILVRSIQSAVEREIKTSKRNARRDVSLHECLAQVEDSVSALDLVLKEGLSSPSGGVHRQEQAALIANQLSRLPENYRELIVLRNLEGVPFEEIAVRMDKTAGAVRAMWARAIARLQQITAEDER